MLYGKEETEFYQLSQTGLARLQSGKLPAKVHPETKRVLQILADWGGTAEWDELKMAFGINPMVLRETLRRAEDLGYVTKLSPPIAQATILGG